APPNYLHRRPRSSLARKPRWPAAPSGGQQAALLQLASRSSKLLQLLFISRFLSLRWLLPPPVHRTAPTHAARAPVQAQAGAAAGASRLVLRQRRRAATARPRAGKATDGVAVSARHGRYGSELDLFFVFDSTPAAAHLLGCRRSSLKRRKRIWEGILARTEQSFPRAQGIPVAAVSPQLLVQRASSRRWVLGARAEAVDERGDGAG
ncbi:unnamed protein product, partial [Urochloa humidicola]